MSWPLVAIEEFCSTGSGGTPSRNKSEFYNGSIPWIKSGDLRENVVTQASEFITPEAIEKSSAKLVKSGAILLAMYGATVGRMALLGIDAATNQAVCNIIPDEEKAFPKYVYYALLNKVPEFINNAFGGAQPNINQGMIKSTKIIFPPLAEQKRIAAILDKADSIRRKRQQAIQLADDFLRSVFLEMFGDLSKDKMTRFGEVVTLDAKMVDPRGPEYIDLLHFGPDRIEKGTGRLLPALTAREEKLISKKFLFDESYVLYSKIRPYLKKCALANSIGLCSADMYPIKPIEGKTTREFIWLLLLSNIFTTYTKTLPDRASIPKLNQAELASFEFCLPEYSRQKKLSKIVRAIIVMKGKVENDLHESESLFSCLNQKAFRGEL
ncbi:restriction endonuclease subunit S [Marinicellulosiphila megalodicopiae]|uniref:restriction endonuclease subunit S n=1 Tax=Marinicellulosiphila megalodicopiae TaxID=2724896 RepID=UPI003BAFF8FF